jgi:hypothetical protein
MSVDTAPASQFQRRLHDADAVHCTFAWLRRFFPPENASTSLLRSLILQLATRATSFHAVGQRALRRPSLSSLRKLWLTFRASHTLSDWETLLNDTLRDPWLPHLRGEEVQVIVDWHAVPYWGQVTPAIENEVRNGPAQNGTYHFFVYATVAVLWRGIRIQVALTRVAPHESQADVFRRLRLQVEPLHLVVLEWILDRAFYTAGVVAQLRETKQPYVIAAPRRGEKEGVAALLDTVEATYGFQEAHPPALTFDHTIHPMDKSIGPQPTRIVIGWEPVVAPKRKRRQRTRRQPKTKPNQRWRATGWACGGREWTEEAAKKAYAPRTGFESGYRQSKQCRGRTSSRDPKWRLFLFAISLLLTNAWIYLLIEGKRTSFRRWEELRGALAFIRMCHWIAAFLEKEVGQRTFVDLPAG